MSPGNKDNQERPKDPNGNGQKTFPQTWIEKRNGKSTRNIHSKGDEMMTEITFTTLPSGKQNSTTKSEDSSTLKTVQSYSTDQSTPVFSNYSYSLTSKDLPGFTTEDQLSISSQRNNNIGPTTDSPRQSTLFISIGFGIAGLFFVVIVCLCFVICRNKKKTAQETYNQYSHVDQTEFLDAPQRDYAQILQVNTAYETIEMDVYEEDKTNRMSSQESGYAEDFNGQFSEKSEHPQKAAIGPQFSELKGSQVSPSVSEQECKDSSVPIIGSSKFTFSPTNDGNENYFTLQPAGSEQMSSENGLNDNDIPDYFTLEKSTEQ
ncbi:uncharacterized protein LOC111107281 isoform X8 [Crassostrea virginica]